ncbi:MAG: N-acetyltransferase [Clostridia bacterium]|nr:N-acetyltransferase [Clostridia bacterium]
MEYRKTVRLKDGRECTLRNGTREDAKAALDNFCLTHEQTDWLLSYPDENTKTVEQEAQFLQDMTAKDCAVELLAELDGKVVGMAGFSRLGEREKIRHRAEFGISVDRTYWGLGIGRALTKGCIECARSAGFTQLELEVVADNENAIALYESEGFVEYGRNPKGFRSRVSGWQELVLMRLELDG